jgi:hypothetical protein
MKKPEQKFEAFRRGADITGAVIGLQCPYCGYDCVHFGSAEDVPDLPGTDYNRLHTRGGAISISMWGECGHTWAITVLGHKGQCGIGVDCSGPAVQEKELQP